jgi:hypothetical protein
MYCLDPISPLFNAIVEMLADSPHLPVSELHAGLRKKKLKVTLQHLYRVVNRMVEAQIVLKERGKLSLNRLWLAQVGIFAENAVKRLEGEGGRAWFPLKDGQHILLTADTLAGVQAVWYSTLAQLYDHLGKDVKVVYKYYAHAWWLTNESDAARKFFREIGKRGVVCYWLFGNDNYLNRTAVKEYKDIFHMRIAHRAVFPTEGYNLNVYGDYVLECIFPQTVSKHLKLLFSSIASDKDFDPALLKDIFDLKGKYVIKLWKNAKLAAQLREKVRQFF